MSEEIKKIDPLTRELFNAISSVVLTMRSGKPPETFQQVLTFCDEYMKQWMGSLDVSVLHFSEITKRIKSLVAREVIDLINAGHTPTQILERYKVIDKAAS